MTDKTSLLKVLKGMLPAQFEEVIFHIGVPHGEIDPGAQSTRALQLLQYAEMNQDLNAVENAIRTVAPKILPAHTMNQSNTTPSAQAPSEFEQAELIDDDSPAPKVLISYSHDSPAHRDFVLGLADRLREDGIDCTIDQYLPDAPAEGWVRWMEKQIDDSNFVLLMCTEEYLHRFNAEVDDRGRGVAFEGVVIQQNLYENYNRTTKFIPLLPEGGDEQHIPITLRGRNSYQMPRDYEGLYRVLTKQPEVVARPLGKRKKLPPRRPS